MSASEEFIVPIIRAGVLEIFEELPSLLPSNVQVLDVGAGSKPFRQEILNRGWKYQSYDIPGINDNEHDHIGFVDGDLPDTLLAEELFDLLICTEVLEHVLDWKAAFSNFRRLTKNGGYIILTAPHFYPLHEEPFDFWRPTPYAFSAYAESNSMKVVRSLQLGDPFDVLGTFCATVSGRQERRCGLNWGLHKAVMFLLRCGFWFLRTRFLQRRVRFKGCYLTNLLLLKA